MAYNKDWKVTAILVLVIAVVFMGTWMAYGSFQNREQRIFNQGLQNGVLQERANILGSVQVTGFYSINIVDQDNNQQTVLLAPVQPRQQAQPIG